jgi:uncharacterized phage-associated protein
MTVTPNEIADYLLCESRYRGEILTHLKLQKLMYYAQAWSVTNRDEALFVEDFQAWVHGPVLPSQYARFRDFGWRPVDIDVKRPDLEPDVRKHLDEIVDVFGVESAVALEKMTHQESPWLRARDDLAPHQACNQVIEKQWMREYYGSL